MPKGDKESVVRTIPAFMIIMTSLGRTPSSLSGQGLCEGQFPVKKWLRFSVLLAIATLSLSTRAHGYVLEHVTWPKGSVITFHVQLGALGVPLQDGSASWAAAVAPVFSNWNGTVGGIRMSTVNTSTAVSRGDNVNSIVFSSTIFGQSFGSSTLAVTYYSYMNSSLTEADVLLNTAQHFNSYRGALQFGSNGYAIPDIRRVLLHELGHAIGLNHPDTAGQHVTAVMNSVISSQETISADDKAGAQSMYGPPGTVAPVTAPTSRLVNISTRLRVGTGDDVLIGGFIITGTQSKRVILRAIGPSLASHGIVGALANPLLELHNSAGALIASNDDWQQSAQAAQITASGVPPTNTRESAIIATLAPGNYTAIVRGANNTTGVALVEGYELGANAARLINISTRGRVSTGDNALICGFIVQGTGWKKVLIRAAGPSLAFGTAPISNALANPLLELHNAAGNLMTSNDNWGSSPQAAQISATGIPPSRPEEPAILATLAPGNYTAIVRGVGNTSGVSLVELYDLDK